MSRILNSRAASFAIAVALVFVLASLAMACPNCKEAMEKQDPTHGGLVKGYFYSILFMMGTPYLVLGTFCGVMYYKVRRARAGGKPKPPLGAAAQVPHQAADAASTATKSSVSDREPIEV
jgi:heme/copper-type cytochrome/quinol oxidase subunit 2